MSFFEELKRRNVVRVGLAYGIAGWVLLQVADLVLENIEAPSWVIQALMLFVLLGFIAAVVIAWAYEITPEGIKKESEVDRTQSIVGHTGKKLDRIIIGFLVLAVAVLLVDRSMSPPEKAEKGSEPFSQETTVQTTEQGDEKRALTPFPGDPSIAVLPFTDMSPEQDQGYFSDGISEELLNLLVRVDGLKVASRTSSFNYKGSNQSLAEIASELKVDHVLEGSVRKADNRIRITAQLIDAKTDRHLWSESFDRELVDIFRIQDEIANAIVRALRSELGMLEDLPLTAVTADTDNLDAYELYLKARALFLAREQLEESIRLFEQAVATDPGFARAWEGLAAVYSVVESWGIYGRDWNSLALEAAQKALAIDPGLSTPWAVMGQLANTNHDYISSIENLDKAIELDPGNATNYLWRGIQFSELNYKRETIRDYEKCLDLDPAYENCRRHLAIAHLTNGDTEKAMMLFQQGLENGFNALNQLFLSPLVNRGNRALAAAIIFRGIEQVSTFPGVALLDAIEFPQRDHSQGLLKYQAWLQQTGEQAFIASLYMAQFGNYKRVEPTAWDNAWVWFDEFEGFRKSDYFKPFVHKMGWLQYWQQKGFPPGCRPLDKDDFECD